MAHGHTASKRQLAGRLSTKHSRFTPPSGVQMLIFLVCVTVYALSVYAVLVVCLSLLVPKAQAYIVMEPTWDELQQFVDKQPASETPKRQLLDMEWSEVEPLYQGALREKNSYWLPQLPDSPVCAMRPFFDVEFGSWIVTLLSTRDLALIRGCGPWNPDGTGDMRWDELPWFMELALREKQFAAGLRQQYDKLEQQLRDARLARAQGDELATSTAARFAQVETEIAWLYEHIAKLYNATAADCVDQNAQCPPGAVSGLCDGP